MFNTKSSQMVWGDFLLKLSPSATYSIVWGDFEVKSECDLKSHPDYAAISKTTLAAAVLGLALPVL